MKRLSRAKMCCGDRWAIGDTELWVSKEGRRTWRAEIVRCVEVRSDSRVLTLRTVCISRSRSRAIDVGMSAFRRKYRSDPAPTGSVEVPNDPSLGEGVHTPAADDLSSLAKKIAEMSFVRSSLGGLLATMPDDWVQERIECASSIDSINREIERLLAEMRSLSGFVRVDYDGHSQVLYVVRDGASVAKSREGSGDGYFLFNLDASGSVVGAQIMFPLDMTLEEWTGHPDRPLLPPDIDEVVDGWFRSEKAHVGDRP